MSFEDESQNIQEQIQELEAFLSQIKDVRIWKRGEAVRLRLLGFSYNEIQEILQVSSSFIAKSQRKFFERGAEGLKLEYKGSTSYLTPAQKEEVKEWLSRPERRNISELERHLIEVYEVIFKSRQSYYQLLKDSRLTWQKGNRENPRKNPEKIAEKNQEINDLLNQYREEIESGRLVVYTVDECHLQGDDICNYLWGDRQNREIVKVANERDRQTYYGAFNIWDKSFILRDYPAGNGENTVKFVREIKAKHPGAKILLLWDGASYHRGEEMKQFLAQENEEKEPKNWSIICCLFAPYAPAENPVEAIWLQVKNFIRRFYYICKNFSIVKKLFQFFFEYQLFNPPNLKKYDAFVQFI